jgi:hypothetical protein
MTKTENRELVIEMFSIGADYERRSPYSNLLSPFLSVGTFSDFQICFDGFPVKLKPYIAVLHQDNGELERELRRALLTYGSTRTLRPEFTKEFTSSLDHWLTSRCPLSR